MNNAMTSLAAASIASSGCGREVRAIDPNHCYRMDHKKRGRCIIFNNKEFAKSTTMAARDGSDFDALSVCEIFRDLLQFDVDMHDNQTTIEMLQIVAKGKMNAAAILATNFNRYQCIVSCFSANNSSMNQSELLWRRDYHAIVIS